MSNGFLTEEEVRSYLSINPKELERLLRREKLTAFRVGGEFLRYRKDEVIALKTGQKFRLPDQLERNWFDKVRDFWNFYSVYVLLLILMVLLVVFFIHF